MVGSRLRMMRWLVACAGLAAWACAGPTAAADMIPGVEWYAANATVAMIAHVPDVKEAVALSGSSRR